MRNIKGVIFGLLLAGFVIGSNIKSAHSLEFLAFDAQQRYTDCMIDVYEDYQTCAGTCGWWGYFQCMIMCADSRDRNTAICEGWFY
ncbi:MAG: hypothetical protein DCC75_09120 [Proteobacteria bacterium]|nr:MAG: hypothetical protein DCC75_09120 [Pseudomonadota bacterium]